MALFRAACSSAREAIITPQLHHLRRLLCCGLLLAGCAAIPQAKQGDVPATPGMDIRLTLLHTSDIHSRLQSYQFDPSFTDNGLGLADDAGPFGGIDKIGYILKRERARSGRVLHLDSGDCFQGAIIFNEFDGEAEMRLMTQVGLNAAVVANHEFDKGATNLANQYGAWGGFDLLAANYHFEDADQPWSNDLGRMVIPSTIYDLDGVRVGVIGLGNISSLNSIYDESNSMGITVLEPEEVIPAEAAKLRSQGADIIVVLSHMGLDDDREQALEFDDVDIFLGGHHHVAIDPPLIVENAHTGKRIPVVHSGAFAKFVGRVDLVIRDGELLSHDYTLFPVDNSVPSDAEVVDILEEYVEALDATYNTDQVLGYAEEKLTRYGSTGGDSMLGNFTAEAMRFYPGVETEIALTNTLGIRADIPPGDITLDDLYNSMPFDNSITTMFLSGREVQELLDYVSDRSTERGCSSQAQIAGIQFDMVCEADNPRAENILINGLPLDEDGTYELATNDYIAHGGSGFEVLERNTTQVDTGISIRDVVQAAFIQYQTLPRPEEGVCVEDGRINTIF
jgi:5'-nucleotidase/UDP-sugar diphosphatase